MNMMTLSFCNLRYRILSNVFNVIILSLGVAAVITLLHISEQVKERFTRDLQGIDLVVGAKGSPLQLILSSVFHLDIPTGNIPLADAEALEKNPLIKFAIPVALGDSYHGFRIVGTTPDYPKHYDAQLAEGDFWTQPMQAVIGSEAARVRNLHVGQTFVGTHGLTEGGEEHTAFPYTITGILKPTGTVVDRLIFTDVGSVWKVHEFPDADDPADAGKLLDKPKPREVTALLIGYRTPLAVASLPRLINKSTSMQAASPAMEMARLYSQLKIGSETVNMFGCILLGIAATGFFVTLFNAVHDRTYDIALIRSLGATRAKVFGFVLAEGVTLGVCGALLGLLLGHVFASLAQGWIENTRHMALNDVGWPPYEGWIMLIALGISVVAAIIPGMMAYRVNVAKVLSQGNG
jgi:putative ABC transport system permease protein